MITLEKTINKKVIIKNISKDVKSFERFKRRLIKRIYNSQYLNDGNKEVVVEILKKEFEKLSVSSFVQEFYDCFEKQIFDNLTSIADDDDNETIMIKLFDGIQVIGTVLPEREKTVNYSGETITVAGKIKVKSHITKHFKEKVNQAANI